MPIIVYNLTRETHGGPGIHSVTLSGYEDPTGRWLFIDMTLEAGDTAIWMLYNTQDNGIYRIIDYVINKQCHISVHACQVGENDPSYYLWKRDLDRVMAEFISPKDE